MKISVKKDYDRQKGGRLSMMWAVIEMMKRLVPDKDGWRIAQTSCKEKSYINMTYTINKYKE